MTDIRVGVVDVFVIRITGKTWHVLALQRAAGTRSAGSWETVHGRIEEGETPAGAARRELREETGLKAARLYSVTVNPFYLHQTGTVQLGVAFAAFVESADVALGREHQAFEWLSVAEAGKRFTWPRESEALVHIRKLFAAGNAGAVEDVLRMP